MSEVRTRVWDDYDARRDPKTNLFCARCQKDLRPDQPRRWVHFTPGGGSIIHPADEALYVSDGADGWYPLGMDCARKTGMEWSAPCPELDAMLAPPAAALEADDQARAG